MERERNSNVYSVATRLEGSTLDRLRAIALREDRSLASVIRRAIEREIDRAETEKAA